MKQDVIIVGAGPVGLLLGGLLGQCGFQVLILEKRTDLPERSQAIGITPPSLEIMQKLGLSADLVQKGVSIRECHVHGTCGRLGSVSFNNIAGDYRFILSLPQRDTMQLLADHLKHFPSVTLQRDKEVSGITEGAEGVTVHVQSEKFETSFVAACDGWRSPVRGMLDIPVRRREYGCRFVMADFNDRTGLGSSAHVYFKPDGAVESFPLPLGRRRWIAQTDDIAELIPQVQRRTEISLKEHDRLGETTFSPWRMDCQQRCRGRVFLCGDAAHVMSPIGGQGMNTGFADAEFVAGMLQAILRRGEDADAWRQRYERERGIAARTAARRAEWGMRLGTWRGEGRSLLRDILFRHVLLRGPLSAHIAPWFAMQSIPYHRFAL